MCILKFIFPDEGIFIRHVHVYLLCTVRKMWKNMQEYNQEAGKNSDFYCFN